MNLTTLANVRSWLGSDPTISTDDAMLSRLIASASQVILNYIQRADLGKTTLTETISGRGERKVQLRNWPVLEVTGLRIHGTTIPESTSSSQYGFFLEPIYGSISGRAQNVGIRNFNNNPYPVGGYPAGYGMTAYMPSNALFEREFPRGVGNIEVDYSYGYCVEDEAATIPATSTYTITPSGPYGSWAGNLGVTLADGTPMTAITSGTPTTGQYLPPDTTLATPRLVYTFAAADASKGVLLSYNYVPFSVEQACIELVSERYRYKDRIGQRSHSAMGQVTTSFDLSSMPEFVKELLVPYRMVRC